MYIFYQLGTINTPEALSRFPSVEAGGLGVLLTIIFRTLVIAGGIYAVFNFIIAGYSFISAGGDPKKIENSWAKIWQTILGLLFIAGAALLAAVIGKLIFGDYNALLDIKIPTVNDL